MPRKRVKLIHGAACPLCRSELRFYTDVNFGALYEQCSNRSCANAVPHRPRPDPDCGPPKRSEFDRLAARAQIAARRRERRANANGAAASIASSRRGARRREM